MRASSAGNPAPGTPRCVRCGAKLNLTPLGWGEPSIDAMNVAVDKFTCQPCLLVEVLEDFH